MSTQARTPSALVPAFPHPPFSQEMALSMSEATLQTNVLGLARILGWHQYHTYDSRKSNPGFPDLFLAHEKQRRLVFAELKTERGRQKGPQKEWERVLRAVGAAEFYLWRPTAWLDGSITRILQARPQPDALHLGASA